MPDIGFSKFVTRDLQILKSEDPTIRKFGGHISAEVVDRQDEYIAQQEILKIMDIFMKLAPNVSEVHTNRTVGRVDLYKASEIEGHPSVYIEGHIFKADDVALYDRVWEKVVKGEYRGLSMGGASKDRVPVRKDGKLAIELKKLELYEIALCPTPANQLAIIDYVNDIAKAYPDMNIKSAEGRNYIQCDSVMCTISKSVPTDLDLDTDIGKIIGSSPENITKAFDYFNKPFAGYEDFEACVRSNKDKGDPKAYCGEIKHKVEKGIYGSPKEKESTYGNPHELAEKRENAVLNDVKSEDKNHDELIKTLSKTILKNQKSL